MCWGEKSPRPSQSDAGTNPPNCASEPCPEQCPPMEIEINNTATTDDDYVQVKCMHPPRRHRVPCRIRVRNPPAPQSTTVVLTNPDGRLRFPRDADMTATVTVPANGSWAAFEISGEVGSNALNDAVIEAHCQTAAGAVIATKTVTVFWFDEARIDVTPGGSYTLTGGRYTATGGNAVNYSAQAQIRPAGVDCSQPQIRDLRIGIIQNNSTASHTVDWGNPVIAWNPGVPAGTTVNVPTTIRRVRQLPAGSTNDSAASVAPLYDQPGKAETLSANSLQPPIGCTGGTAATTLDTPSEPAPPTRTLPATTAAGANVGTVTYSLVNVTLNDSFTTWTVVFNRATNHLCALRERTWNLNVDSAAPGAQQATVSASDNAQTATPVTAAPFSVSLFNAPANLTTTTVGTTTFTK